MPRYLNKELVKKLLEMKGEVRGAPLVGDREYVIGHCGKDKLRKVEERLKELGVDLKYEKVKDLGFYPVGLRVISLLALGEICNLNGEGFKNLCFLQPRFSLVVRLFTRFLLSPKKAFEQAPKFWREYFTIGKLSLKEFNEKEGYVILKLENFKLHPLYCKCLEGYIKGIVKIIVRSDKVTCKETKCVFKGDKYHEFLAKWPVKEK